MTKTGIEFIAIETAPLYLKEEHLARYNFASQFVANKNVLDIACGTGYGSEMLAKAGAAHVDGVDLSPSNIEYAKAHHQHEKITFRTGDITTYTSDTKYDVVVSFETIEHVQDYHKTLANLYQLLLPGGRLIISTPNRPMSWRPARTLDDKPHNQFHVREFNLEEFKSVLREHGFHFSDDDVYGQRPHIYIRNRYLRKIYHEIFKPYTKADPTVKKVFRLPPLYIVIVAQK